MTIQLNFSIKETPFNEDYHPSETTRLTTNFANLARGDRRKDNLARALAMINNRFNALANWDNKEARRYSLDITILTIEASFDAAPEAERFPIIEMLKTQITDHRSGQVVDGMIGNSFSSYLRDFDFSIALPKLRALSPDAPVPEDFGELHGKLFKSFICSQDYSARFAKQPVICLSVSSAKTYRRSENHHPILGTEYLQDDYSITDDYFRKMGMRVRYFMARGAVAPMAFYFTGDLLGDYSNLELISTIATMESFQKIYRPEIYNANCEAGSIYRPSLSNHDYSNTLIVYDRDERSRLATEQAHFAEQQFIKPHRDALSQWCANFSA